MLTQPSSPKGSTLPPARHFAHSPESPLQRELPPGPGCAPLFAENLAAHQSQRVQQNQLTLLLDAAVANCAGFPELVKQFSDVVQGHSPCLAIWVALPEEDGQFQKFRSVTDQEDDPVWPIAGEAVETVAHACVETGHTGSLEIAETRRVVVVPVRESGNLSGRPIALWAACFEATEQAATRQQWLLGMVGQATAAWFQRRKLTSSEQTAGQMADAFNCLSSLGQTTDLNNMGIALSNQLRKSFAATQVAIAIGQNAKDLSLLAISDVEQVDHQAASTQCLKRACAAGGLLGKPTVWPSESAEASAECSALRLYCETHDNEAAISIPLLVEDGKLVGTLLIAVEEAQLQRPGFAENVLRTSNLLSGQLAIAIRANRSVGSLLIDHVQQLKKASWARYAAVAALVASILLCIPLPYRVACDCSVQPVQRRFVTAPYDGILERAEVKAGDVVTAGQLLATMDGANLRSELAGLKAELAAAQQRRDSALAVGEVAQSQIARSEMKRHLARVEIILHQLTDLEIRSPIDGIVVNGDLEKVQGAALEMGQTVFEVAPLENMLAEIEIDEAEIQYVAADMPVKIKLNAFPFRSWTGTVKRIHPGTELIDGDSVFVAEVELPNEELQLRPGMKGAAKIRANWATLGWSLFHRPWESVRYWTIW